MQSTELLPALLELPIDESGRHKSFTDHITGIVNMDKAMFAAEFASTVSFGMWGVFSNVNVEDRLFEAYATRWPQMSSDQSLYEKWQELLDSGEGFRENEWFYSGLKGQLAEFEAQDWLEQNGYSSIEFPTEQDGDIDPTNEGWDINAIDPDGEQVFFQVKTGAIDPETGIASYASDVIKEMDASPAFEFLVGSEIYGDIERLRPDLVDRLADIGPEHELVNGISDGLETLSSNMGIDIPDGIVEAVPYAGAIIAGARLIYSVIKTEKEFKAADRTTKNKIQVVQSLAVMSRYGVNTVLATLGGAGGMAAGSIIPGPGNLIGGIAGLIGGVGMGMYLNKHLQPHMLNLALNITGLTNDDLFYYKNKPRIDQVATSFQTKARVLAATPAF